MGIAKLNKASAERTQTPPKEPSYRNTKGVASASVWEGERNGVYFLSAKFQRVFIDANGRRNFVDSWEPHHLPDLMALIAEVKTDMQSAIDEQIAAGKKVSSSDDPNAF